MMSAQRPILLLTRPQEASEAFWADLPKTIRNSVELLVNPLMSIRFLGQLPDLENVRGLIFTSANALSAYRHLGGVVLDVPAFAVGNTTAAQLRAFGFKVEVGGGDADGLVALIKAQGVKGPLLHLRGTAVIGDIAKRLTNAGIVTEEAIIYAQSLCPFTAATREALSQDRPVIAPVFSPRTARQLRNESEGLENMRFAAISPAVADKLPNHTFVAQQPNRDCMVALVSEMIANPKAFERPRS